MIAINTYPLDWFRLNSRERAYQLRAGYKKLMSLTWQNIPCARASAECLNERWFFTCIGYVSKQVIVQVPSGDTIAVFTPGAGGGVLRFANGCTYKLKTPYHMHPKMVWENAQGETLVRFHGEFGMDDRSGGVELSANVTPDDHCESELLISLGWYLMITSYLDMTLIL
jgi:hypothetical protein